MRWCDRCELGRGCICPQMPGCGPVPCDIMIVGEAPGANEDALGKPFVGKSGALLRRTLEEYGINPDKCYITNAVKCRPPQNRTPMRRHIKACAAHLENELAVVQPRFILTLGGISTEALTGERGILSVRGSTRKLTKPWGEVLVVPAFHPALVLRQPERERVFRSDIAFFARCTIGEFTPPHGFEFVSVHDNETLDKVRKAADKANVIAYDIENEPGVSEHKGKIYMVSLSMFWFDDSGQVTYLPPTWVIPVEHTKVPKPDLDRTYALLGELLGPSDRWFKIGQYARHDNRWLRARGVKPYVHFDTYNAGYVIDETLPHGLSYLSKVYCNAPDYKSGQEFSEDRPWDTFAEYNALDSYYDGHVYKYQRQELLKDERLLQVFSQIVMPGSRALEDLEERGMYVHEPAMRDALALCRQKMHEAQEAIESQLPAFKGINLNSNKQLAQLLYSTKGLGLKPIEHTPAGEPKVDKDILVMLEHPTTLLIRQNREYAHHISSFLNPWHRILQTSHDGRIHTTYKISSTSTGRLAAEEPNLQQVPRDKLIRSLIREAEPGWVFVEADFSQIELRVIAHIAQERTMLDCFLNGVDIHKRTASACTGRPIDEIDDAWRFKAKAINFGLCYGMTLEGFRKYLWTDYGIKASQDEAQQMYEMYFKTYSQILPWHQRQIAEARVMGQVRSPFGRIRHLPAIFSSEKGQYGEACRQAINTPVQSSASDLMLLALIKLNDDFKANAKRNRGIELAQIIGTCHDAIFFRVREQYLDQVCAYIRHVMTHPDTEQFGFKLTVPLEVEIKVGPWGSGVKWNK